MALRTPSEAVAYATTHLTNGYNGLCLAHVQDAYGAVPVEPSAISAWNNSKHKHPTADLASAPYGAPIYWSQPGNPYGHIALHLDGDRMYTTDSAAGHPHEASISDWQNRYGYQPLGWTEDIENQPIPGIGEDMAISDQDAQKIAEKVWGYNYRGAAPGGNMFNLLVYELAHLVWAYKNSKVNGDKDAYRLLTDIAKNGPHDTWAYKNNKVNGDDDAYKLLTEIHQQLGQIIDQMTTTGTDQ